MLNLLSFQATDLAGNLRRGIIPHLFRSREVNRSFFSDYARDHKPMFPLRPIPGTFCTDSFIMNN